MLRLAGLVIALLGLIALSCGGGNGNGTESTATVDDEAAIRVEAEALCPEGADACVSSYISQADSSRSAVLCVSEAAGTWYLATPGATPDASLGQEGNEGSAIGDDCREPGHKVVAVIGADSDGGATSFRPTTAADAVETIKAEVTITQGQQTEEAGQQANRTPRSTPTQPAPTVPPVTNRRDCNAIRGTDYLSEEERGWFLDNCVAPSPTPPQAPPPVVQNCHPSYPDVCLATNAGDYDCAGGSGNGPNYVRGPIRVLPPDPFGLDRDGDGIGCE